VPKKWQVKLLRQAKSYLKRLPAKEVERILSALYMVQNDPEKADIKPLEGRPEFSLRVGDKRILMQINTSKKEIIVTRIGSRGDIYKNKW